MSTFEVDGWDVDETVALISILKSLKDRNESRTIGKVDWQHVAAEMSESLRDDVNSKERDIPELRERYKKLRADYFTARYRNVSCQYYNMLNDLFRNELAGGNNYKQVESEEDMQETEPSKEFEEDTEEQKYAHTLQLEPNDDETNRSGKLQQRCKWAEGELDAFLNIITTHKLQTPLLRKRNAKVFKLISREMAKRQFVKRPDQLRIKYHQLRRQYAKAKNGGETFEHFEDMHALLNDSIRHGESSDSDSIDSGEEDGDARIASGSDSEGALVSLLPTNRRCKWTEGEVDIFLDTITTLGLESALLRKRNAKIYLLLSKELAKRSIDKPAEKLRIKFQQLRRLYNKAKNGGESFEQFEAMHKLLSHKNVPNKSNPDANLSSGSESDYMYSDDGDADPCKRHADSYYWTDLEVDAFLSIIKEQNLFRALDGSKKRNFKILTYISNILAKQSCKRTPHQLRNKLRLMMRRYHEVKKDGLKNVRMLPRHYEMLDDLMQKKRTSKSAAVKGAKEAASAIKMSPKTVAPVESDSDASSSQSSCDLFRAAAESEDSLEMPADPTPLEVLTTISEGQKQLVTMLTNSHESFMRQQREMQAQFLREMSSIMRQEREATFKMMREMMQPK
ncbi:uncharacterized protein LOC117785341 [Drosophila innubila]|uniref:uncharacterized protein LOC117785341 n=1 Tax=Drosophila innubila TaxID=198719 RepID=UPI00148D4BFF|nr:uncharacterized protein LOC117785341 [Drosophila innubila]